MPMWLLSKPTQPFDAPLILHIRSLNQKIVSILPFLDHERASACSWSLEILFVVVHRFPHFKRILGQKSFWACCCFQTFPHFREKRGLELAHFQADWEVFLLSLPGLTVDPRILGTGDLGIRGSWELPGFGSSKEGSEIQVKVSFSLRVHISSVKGAIIWD